MKRLFIALIISFSFCTLFAQEHNLERPFEDLEKILDELSHENGKSDFDFLVKYYEDLEQVEKRYEGVDNVDAPGVDQTQSFKMNRMIPFKMYPNPSNGNFFIEFFGEQGQLKIIDSFGKEVCSEKPIDLGKYEIRMNHLNRGIYFVEVNCDSNLFKRRLLID